MQGIIFEYDPVRSKRYRQFTVRLSDRKKENNRWIRQGRSRVYAASDLPKIAGRVIAPELFKIALESEMAFRKAEARFLSPEVEFTVLRVSQNDLNKFILGSQKKQILCDAGGNLLTFDLMTGVILEIRADVKNKGYLLKAFLWDIELSKLDYLIRAKTVTGLCGYRVLSLHPDIPIKVVYTLPLDREITEADLRKIQQDLSRYGDKILFKVKGKEQKQTRLKSALRPVLNLDASLRYADLFFWYDNKIMVEDKDTREIILDTLHGIELERSTSNESKCHGFLKRIGVQHPQLDRGQWYIPPPRLEDVLNRLAENNFMIQVDHEPLELTLDRNWRIDVRHRDVLATVTAAGKTGIAEGSNLLEAYFSRKRYVRLSDGRYGFLSSHLMDELRCFTEKGKVKGDRIVFRDVDFPVLNDLIQDRDNITIDDTFRQLSPPESDSQHLKAYPISNPLRHVLRPYQAYGFYWLMWLYQSGFNGILADDMGLGKTLQVLTLLLHLKSCKLSDPCLLIVPKTLIHNWEIEIGKFTPSLSYRIHSGSNRSRNPEDFSGIDLVITSYGLIRLDGDTLGKRGWEFIILDEAQAIKNPRAKVTRALKRIHSRHRLSLSGTPVENSPLDLWSQFDFLMPGMLGTMKAFKDRYGQLQPEAMKELQLKTRPYILRRLKHQVCHELPQKTEVTLFCDFTEGQKEVYEGILGTGRKQIREEMDKKQLLSMHLLAVLLRLRQVACDPALVYPEKNTAYPTSGKQEVVLETAKTILSEGYKILIFSQFVGHLRLMESRFKDHGISSFYMDGQIGDRQEVIDRFKRSGAPCVFFISIKTGGLGLNLTEASYAFLLDPWWNPAVESQAIDRCYRIGQENPVTVYRFITRNSIEENVMALKERKRDIEQQIIGESDLDSVPLTEESLIQLLFQ